ncbi:hypothetical protein LAZ67_19002128 [Cordylochernes scorpioides]|uniref:Uncharacterized protein n=1 Tax=Cordylochernes scorpioides TaxID=51811 RepID=A0ABY6LMH1_9ARAC|nr:hypothetical protein LAZ67_19002128 [Cordylochernes scorpioides]
MTYRCKTKPFPFFTEAEDYLAVEIDKFSSPSCPVQAQMRKDLGIMRAREGCQHFEGRLVSQLPKPFYFNIVVRKDLAKICDIACFADGSACSDSTIFPTDIITYKRYINDIFCICTANKVNHKLTSLNSNHPEINFTLEIQNNNKLPFLDINIIRSQQGLKTSIYYKSFFKPNYIHFSSYCPLIHKINTAKKRSKRMYTHCSLQNSKIEETQNIIK